MGAGIRGRGIHSTPIKIMTFSNAPDLSEKTLSNWYFFLFSSKRG